MDKLTRINRLIETYTLDDIMEYFELEDADVIFLLFSHDLLDIENIVEPV